MLIWPDYQTIKFFECLGLSTYPISNNYERALKWLPDAVQAELGQLSLAFAF